MFSHLKRHFFLRFGCAGTKMRRGNDIIKTEKHIIGGGFYLKHIKGGTRDMATFQCCRHCQLVNKTPTRTIDDPNAFFGFVQRIGANDISCCIG